MVHWHLWPGKRSRRRKSPPTSRRLNGKANGYRRFSTARRRAESPCGRGWLKGLLPEDRKRIGEDIKTVEFGWPVGMPVCKPLRDGIYEVRTSLAQNRIARVLFYIAKMGRMVLLHGFVKKTQKTPGEDLALAKSNEGKHGRGLQ